LTRVRKDYDGAKATVQEKTAELNRASKEIQSLEVARDTFLKEAQNASLEARKVSHKLKQWDKDFKDASKSMNALLKQHPWIEKEKSFFGKVGTDFDFATKDIQQCYRRLKALKNDQERLSKKINKKVMGMIENAEAEYTDLTHKREIILKDKEKIESVIVELDEKKKQALHKTWQQVNKDFGSIFSTLLPQTNAKLEPLEGCDVSDGLEIRVSFNNVWKESLTELSGGQRSLLTLSLILSLLLFKPAPMYILDEVDAALDLNHTQNIGLMIKNHFSASQFIVVSLKEGMFNNANVIFRTGLNDGMSCVTRTVAGARARGSVAGLIPNTAAVVSTPAEDADELESAPAKKKGKSSAKS
jgi:structural maintenance of chromosome 2